MTSQFVPLRKVVIDKKAHLTIEIEAPPLPAQQKEEERHDQGKADQGHQPPSQPRTRRGSPRVRSDSSRVALIASGHRHLGNCAQPKQLDQQCRAGIRTLRGHAPRRQSDVVAGPGVRRGYRFCNRRPRRRVAGPIDLRSLRLPGRRRPHGGRRTRGRYEPHDARRG